MLTAMMVAASMSLTLSLGQPPVLRSCATGMIHLHQSLPPSTHAEAFATLHTTNITGCCAACLSNSTGCAAWYAKVGGPDGVQYSRGANLNECHLYDSVAAAHLRIAGCPQRDHRHRCASALWIAGPPSPPSPPAPSPSPPPHTPRPDVVELLVNSTAAWTVSPYLASMSLVYEWAPDYHYDIKLNGSITKWAKKHQLKIARYPAGQASQWNWESPSGYMGISSFDPTAPSPAPAADWMSLGEYLELCREIGSRPLIGVNYYCGNNHAKFCGTSNESIARAMRQVEYVVQQGFPGAFYYIGNEECQTNCEGFKADLIARHARAMKSVDPTIKTMFSSNEIRPRVSAVSARLLPITRLIILRFG